MSIRSIWNKVASMFGLATELENVEEITEKVSKKKSTKKASKKKTTKKVTKKVPKKKATKKDKFLDESKAFKNTLKKGKKAYLTRLIKDYEAADDKTIAKKKVQNYIAKQK